MGQRGGTHEGERAEQHRPTPQPMGGPLYQPAPGFSVPWSNVPTASFGTHQFPGVRAQAGRVRQTADRPYKVPTVYTHRPRS